MTNPLIEHLAASRTPAHQRPDPQRAAPTAWTKTSPSWTQELLRRGDSALRREIGHLLRRDKVAPDRGEPLMRRDLARLGPHALRIPAGATGHHTTTSCWPETTSQVVRRGPAPHQHQLDTLSPERFRQLHAPRLFGEVHRGLFAPNWGRRSVLSADQDQTPSAIRASPAGRGPLASSRAITDWRCASSSTADRRRPVGAGRFIFAHLESLDRLELPSAPLVPVDDYDPAGRRRWSPLHRRRRGRVGIIVASISRPFCSASAATDFRLTSAAIWRQLPVSPRRGGRKCLWRGVSQDADIAELNPRTSTRV